MAKTGEITAKWHLVDVSGKVLGRVSTVIATILMGKHRPEYTPHVDTGDFVVVINADKIKFTGDSKGTQRTYQRYSGYPGGRKVKTLDQMMAEKPHHVIRHAIRRMLPKNRLGVDMLSKLKVYNGPEHPHAAQNPQPLELD